MFELLGVFLLLLSGYCAGRLVFTRHRLSALEHSLFAVALGLALLSLAYAVLGLLHLYHPALIIGVFIVPILGWIGKGRSRGIRRVGEVLRSLPRSFLRESTAIRPFTFGCLTLILVVMAGKNFAEVLQWNSCPDLYHVFTARAYLNAGGFQSYPGLLTTCYPMMSELLYLPLFFLCSETADAAVHWTYGVLLIMGLYAFGRRFGSIRAGLFAALFYYGCRIVIRVNCLGYIGLTLTFYLFMTLYALILYFEREEAIWMRLGGFFAGVAVTVKLLALPYILLPVTLMALYFVVRRRQKRLKIGRDVLVSSLLFVLPYVPWAIKNGLATGNPMYPFLVELFPTSEPFAQAAAVFHGHHAWVGMEKLRHFGPVLTRRLETISCDGYITTILLPITLLYGFLQFRRRAAVFWLPALFSLGAFIVMLLFGFTQRFYVASLPSTAWLAGWVLDDLLNRLKTLRWGEPVIVLCLAGMMFCLQFLAPHYLSAYDQWYRGRFFQMPPLWPSQREALLNEKDDCRGIIQRLNQILEKDSLLLPENIHIRSLSALKTPFIPNSFRGYPYFGPTLREIGIQEIGAEKVKNNPEVLRKWLRLQGVTHLLLGPEAQKDFSIPKKELIRWQKATFYEL